MGIESILGAVAGPMIGGLLGGGGSSSAGNQTVTTKNEIDPRMAEILYGKDGSGGLLSRFQGLLDQSQNADMAGYGAGQQQLLSNYGGQATSDQVNAANRLMGGNIAPSFTGFTGAQAAQIKAPEQNDINLRGDYEKMIRGNPAENPYLTGAIQGGINQSTQAFGRMQDDSTRNLMERVLPGIRSGAQIVGGFGGNRQGIAEGRAIGDFGRSQQQAITDFGQRNTDAAVGAQAGAFDRGSDRALSAMQGLGAQQYGVAGQQASLDQAANLANLGADQNTIGMNMNSIMDTNRLNSANTLAGLGASRDIFGGAYGVGGAQDQYGMNRAQGVSGLIAPYTGLGGTSTQTQPLYENRGAGLLGGALAGGQIGKMIGGAFGGFGGAPSYPDYMAFTPGGYG